MKAWLGLMVALGGCAGISSKGTSGNGGQGGVPTGGDVAYMDRGPDDPGFVELITATPGMEQAFTAFWRASVGWDGRDPIRPFA